MTIALYMDVHVRGAITQGLRRRGVDVVTAQEDGARQLFDPQLLNRATASGRVVFTNDLDFLRETSRRQQTGEFFAGLVYEHQNDVHVGQCVHDLELIAKVLEPDDLANRVIYLPL